MELSTFSGITILKEPLQGTGKTSVDMGLVTISQSHDVELDSSGLSESKCVSLYR